MKIWLLMLLFPLWSDHLMQGRKAFSQLYVLEGTWVKPDSNKGNLYEEWVKVSDTNMQGRVYKIISGDTVVSERATLTFKQKQIVFVATVMGEEDQQPVPFFISNTSGKNRFIFENPTHDFPKRVAYELISKDSIHAWIDGGAADPGNRVEYGYRRLKN